MAALQALPFAPEESIGKISIFPGPDRSVFAPTADKPVLVGFSKSGCSEDGCQKEGTLCGTLKATKNVRLPS